MAVYMKTEQFQTQLQDAELYARMGGRSPQPSALPIDVVIIGTGITGATVA
jgi:hypothetical protein